MDYYSEDRLILTHNIGTTGNTAVLYTIEGEIVKSWLTNYPTFYKNGNQVEQNPEHWWKAVCESTKNVMRGIHEKSVLAVSFSGQMMGCLCVDRCGDPLQNAIIWADMRARKESEKLHDLIDENQFYRITGHRISSAYTLSKILWIKNNRPDIYAKTDKIMLAKDYIVYRMTGRIVTDYSDATGTNLFDLTKREWSRTILSIAGLEPEMLPEVIESTEVAGLLTIDAAEETGLIPGTPVIIGAGDGICSAIGGTSTSNKDAYIYFGSSAWIGLTSNTPYFDPDLRTFNWDHVGPGLYSPCGTMQAAGASIDWARDQIARIETSQAEVQGCHPQTLIEQEILRSPAGANGLLFLPYMLGERSPYWNARVKGSLIGLKMKHSRSDLLRSFIEGVALNLKIIWNTLLPAVGERKELVLVGGQAMSDVNKQILSDVLGIPMVSHDHVSDSKNFGAAILGGIGIGVYDSIDSVKEMVTFTKRVEPDISHTALYNEILPVFEKSYKALESIHNDLDRIQTDRRDQ